MIGGRSIQKVAKVPGSITSRRFIEELNMKVKVVQEFFSLS